MTYKIEKNVGIPESVTKYPFRKMELKDSFLFDEGDKGKVRSAAKSYSKNHPPLNFTVIGNRCWRTK